MLLKSHLEELHTASLWHNVRLQQLRTSEAESRAKTSHTSVLICVPTRPRAADFPLQSTSAVRLGPLQTRNDSSDANKIIPDWYSRMEGGLLGLHRLHPENTLTQRADTAKQSLFPISPRTAHTRGRTLCEICYSISHFKMQLKAVALDNRIDNQKATNCLSRAFLKVLYAHKRPRQKLLQDTDFTP